MQQALALLQAPVLELNTLIQTELAQNPVLEQVDPDEWPTEPTSDSTRDGEGPSDAELDARIDQLRKMDEDARAFSSVERGANHFSQEDEERRQFFFDSLAEQETLSSHLLSQLRLATEDATLLRGGEEVIGNLEPDGYLRTPLDEVAAAAQMSVSDATLALDLVQTFHPPGIAARDLRECLLIQLRRDGKIRSIEIQILERCMDDLAHHRFEKIAKTLGIPAERVKEAAATIATLDPRPGHRLASEDRQSVVVAEIEIYRDEDVWKVKMLDELVPRIRISATYKDLLAIEGSQAELRSYLREKMRAGRSLLNCIEHRQQTIQRIAEDIVRHQREFLDFGLSRLKPLTLAQVAAEVGVHETTVSRAISGKYVRTPHGVFELKFFFNPGFQTVTGETISNKSIKDALQEIVAKEDSRKPYSDEEIIKIFKERGISLARRTIAKYRAELGILPSNLRRER